MIQITHSNLANIAIEYKGLIRSWLYFDEVYANGNSKDRILKIKNTSSDVKYLEMLQQIHDDFDNLIVINSVEDFRIAAISFIKKFKNEILEYRKAAENDKKKTSFGLFKEKMQYFYKSFFDDSYSGSEKGFSDYSNGGWLTKKLNITTCPYCNRQYTFTIYKGLNKLKTRPQLDHFFPKSIYPFLALSFYNLIPSCPTCNHIKSENKIDLHPYMVGFNTQYKFIAGTVDGSDFNSWIMGKRNVAIKFSAQNKNIKRLGLNELYNEHIDYVEEIIDKCIAYNNSYYESLINSFNGLDKTEEEIDRIIWGNYLEVADYKKRPLSKITKDILEQFSIK